jgi:activator of HSP90 ATPase
MTTTASISSAYGLTRRHLLAGAVIAVGSLATRAARAEADEISESDESIHQEIIFKASRKHVYAALTDAKQFDKIVHLSAAMQLGMKLGTKPTDISRDAGGTFVLFGGHIVGRHIELVPDARIVQAWRVVDWNPGVYSIARFELAEHGAETRLIFDHAGFPKGEAKHLAEGWKGNYWEPLAKVLA